MKPEDLKTKLVKPWNNLPAHFGFQIMYADKSPRWSIEDRNTDQFNIGSAFKPFVLAEFLRQSAWGLPTLQDRVELVESQRVPDSAFLGKYADGELVSIRQLLEAIISVSDNTATEIIMQMVKHENIMSMLREVGLTDTQFPSSLRAMVTYALGLDPPTTRFNELLVATEEEQTINSKTAEEAFQGQYAILSSPSDLVTFYERAFAGDLFQIDETLEVFKEIMRLEDATQETVWPPDIYCYRKSGNIELAPYYGFAIAGSVMDGHRRFNFAFCLNYQLNGEGDFEQSVYAFGNAVRLAFQYFRDYLSP